MFEPEVSSLSVVVIVDIGDDFSEPDCGASWWVYAGASGDTEGHFLLDTSNPAFTTKFTLFYHSEHIKWGRLLSGIKTLKQHYVVQLP